MFQVQMQGAELAKLESETEGGRRSGRLIGLPGQLSRLAWLELETGDCRLETVDCRLAQAISK